MNALSAEKYKEFMDDLSETLIQMPVVGVACVIDQAGYHDRYLEIYRENVWWLCKTAFSICVERCTKYALLQNRKIRINVERADPSTDKKIQGYYEAIKLNGMPFQKTSMGKYNPLQIVDFKEALYELKLKQKQSVPMQIADLFLYAICRGGYEPSYKPFNILKDNGKLIDNIIENQKCSELGIKYSCFEGVKIKAQL